MADGDQKDTEETKKNVVKLKYMTFIDCSETNNASTAENLSLQEAFLRYKEAKQNDIRKERMLRKRRELRKADPQKMAALRQKFVTQAKKYYGYPYAKKYWPPDSPEYKSKLFLDCCGLVRRVMRDLEEDFGFSLGPWNQAYMYDTLPITVACERDMKPGDLVFISATYYNPKSKKQRHNMTHVEIWAGEGNKTIGARWNNGKVALWDSYKFTAKSYHSETYHFKSLDTWLRGICKSFCPDHRWKRRKYNPKKKSIFAVPEEIQGDEAAGDDDDNVDSFLVRGNTFCQKGNTKGAQRLPPRPKTEMDRPSFPHSASSESLEKQRLVPVRPIKNDQNKGKGQATRAKTSLGMNERSLTFSDGFRLEIEGTGQGKRDQSDGTKNNSKGKQNSSGNLTELGPKDMVGSRHDACNGNVEEDLDADEDEDEHYGVDDGSDDSDDEYLDDEISGEEMENTESKDVENGYYISAVENSGKADMLDVKLDGNHNSDGKHPLTQNSSSSKDKMAQEKDDAKDQVNKKSPKIVTNVEQSHDIDTNENIKSAEEELNTNQSANIENSTKDVKEENESIRKNKKQSSKPKGLEIADEGQGHSESGMSIAIATNKCTSVTSIRSGELGDSEGSSKGLDAENPSDPSEEASGTEPAKRGRRKKSPGGTKGPKLPSCSLPTNMTPTFYVGGGNGTSLVEGPLVNIGWKRTTDKFDERFRLKWVESKCKINYGSFKEGEQMVNHLPNSHLLTNKLGLLNSLKEYERVTLSTKGRLPRLRMSDFHPETYKLDEKSDRDLFLEIYKDNEIWICKPVGMNQGKGIFLLRSREAIMQILEEREQRKQEAQKPGRPLMNRIVQRYIMKPLLLEGHKFDVRSYMLIASTCPFLILYHKGYIRRTCTKYDPNDLNLGSHLTNQFVQKKDPLYKDIKEDTAWTMDKFNDYVNEKVRPDCKVEIEEDWVYNTFTKQMQKIMIHCFNSVKHKLQSKVGYFDLFGLDFMVDAEMKVHLIEVNTNPALHCNCEALKDVIPGVVEESLYVAIECFEKSRRNQPLMPLQSLKNFTILYCGTRPNAVIPRQIRSVSPVKESASVAIADKPKLVTAASVKRASSPSRAGQRSLTTQSTSLYQLTQRRPSEKPDASAVASGVSASMNSIPSAKTSKTGLASKSRQKSDVESRNKETKDSDKAEKAHIKFVDDKFSEEEKTDDSKEFSEDESKEEPEKETTKVVEQPKAKTSTVVVDTLSKTTDSLNQATSALGRLSLSLNQVGLADSLLEEVRLKMTHAEQQSSPTATVAKPKSARPKSRAGENLDRGN
ncbi:uncharacterized protein LOC127880994 isoform X1 [Dreissena polymorpha]|uniref:uncharacterized protein LOC127880994 isoform X1 n=2 Tax=Dreissena polymorpha TaxID=45954 RepID=UPI00226558A2|nr:uncharacterized protein LOC127880994 isoform X1 [Dreissena polymorpha]